MQLPKIPDRAIDFIKDHGSGILTILAVGGVASTAILAAEAGQEHEKLRQQHEITGDVHPKQVIKCYVPPAVSGAITCFCILEANVLNQRQKAALLACYLTMQEAYKDYRRTNIEVNGEEADERVINAQKAKRVYVSDELFGGLVPASDHLPADGDILVWTEEAGYFNISVADLLQAEKHFQKALSLDGYVTLILYYDLLGVTPKEPLPADVGWTYQQMMEECCTTWFDILYHKHNTDDGLEYWTIDPMLDPIVIEDFP